jgi:hypothetical protein
MRGLGNFFVGVEMRISAAANFVPSSAFSGMVETLAMRGRVVPFGASGMR